MSIGLESSSIKSSSNIVLSYNKFCNISNLNGCHKNQIIGSVENLFVGLSNKYTIGVNTLPIAGDMLKITNSSNFLQTNLSIDFDTNNDSIPNTSSYQILNFGSTSNPITLTDTLVLLFDGVSFHNIDVSETANKYILKGDNIIFNAFDSNITESVSVSSNTIELSNSFYNISCAKYYKTTNTANASVNTINGVDIYPSINKIFSNINNVITTYNNDTLKSANKIILTASSFGINGVYDFLELRNINNRYIEINKKNY
jgi:hypothetical protein